MSSKKKSRNPDRKIHISRKNKDSLDNYVMWCGKTFSSGDRDRLRKHVTAFLENVNCGECVEAFSNFLYDKPDNWWFVRPE